MIGESEAAKENSSWSPTFYRPIYCATSSYNHILRLKYAPRIGSKFATTAAMWATVILVPRASRSLGRDTCIWPGYSMSSSCGTTIGSEQSTFVEVEGNPDTFTMPEIETLEDEVGFCQKLVQLAT